MSTKNVAAVNLFARSEELRVVSPAFQPVAFSNVTDVNFEQLENAPLPILVTLSGIVIDVNDEHL